MKARFTGGVTAALAVSMALACAAQTASPSGRFTLSYERPASRELRGWERKLRENKAFEKSIRALNNAIRLPHDVRIVVAECDEPNAFYDLEERRIIMCYELAAQTQQIFEDDASTDEELTDLVLAALDFVLHHEVGHSLVHVLDLPITGKEEDAVDDLATLIYIRSGDEDVALVAATHFFDEGVEEIESAAGVEDLAFYDEHSFSLQRFYSIVCLVIGSDPAEHGDLLSEMPELEERNCEAEFQQKDRAWDRLLRAYYK